jgi:hypothetical protein
MKSGPTTIKSLATVECYTISPQSSCHIDSDKDMSEAGSRQDTSALLDPCFRDQESHCQRSSDTSSVQGNTPLLTKEHAHPSQIASGDCPPGIRYFTETFSKSLTLRFLDNILSWSSMFGYTATLHLILLVSILAWYTQFWPLAALAAGGSWHPPVHYSSLAAIASTDSNVCLLLVAAAIIQQNACSTFQQGIGITVSEAFNSVQLAGTMKVPCSDELTIAAAAAAAASGVLHKNIAPAAFRHQKKITYFKPNPGIMDGSCHLHFGQQIDG